MRCYENLGRKFAAEMCARRDRCAHESVSVFVSECLHLCVSVIPNPKP